MAFKIIKSELSFVGYNIEVSDALDSSLNSAKDSIKEPLGKLLSASISECVCACNNANECECFHLLLYSLYLIT